MLPSGLLFKAQEALQQMAIITAAIGGKKANKLISLLRSRQNGVGYLADSRYIFPDETKLVNIFNVGDDKANHFSLIFSPTS